jgi:carotenoid cleavage dioxygenase-like enzyme
LADEIVAFTETRMPIRFDPGTLNTLGEYDYDEQIKGPVSIAHPHNGIMQPATVSVNRSRIAFPRSHRVRHITLPQLCQNYMSLCVRIGKIDRLRPPLNA